MTARHAYLACAAVLVLAACQGPERNWPSGKLRSGGKPVAAALGPGEVHRYPLPLNKGCLLRLVVDQQGIDAEVTLEDPGGTPVLKADRAINDRGLELVLVVAKRDGVHTLVIHGLEDSRPGRYEARVEALRPASKADRRSAHAYRLFTGANDLELVEPEKAMKRWTQALAIWRELGEVALEAEVLERMARHHNDHGERQLAVDRYREAAAGFERVRSPRWEAIARSGLGASLVNLGKGQEAEEQYAVALSLARQVADPLIQAEALHGLGQAFLNQGELQKALDHSAEALKLWPQDHPTRPNTLHQLGVLHARYLHDERRGRELLLEARDAWEPDQWKRKARTLSQLGRLSQENGRPDEARRYYEEALALQRDNAPCDSAVVLARLALLEEGQGKRAAADARREEALRIVGAEPCPRSEPTVHLLAARLAEERGDHADGFAGYRRSEELFADLGDRMGMAESLAGLARNARALGDRQAARKANRRALDILEGVRPTVLSEDLRISFFSGARAAFDFQIDLLLELGAEEEAWVTAEEARNRALQDLLAEAGAGPRGDAAPPLVTRERALQRDLNALETRRLTMGESKPEKLQTLRKDIDDKVAELESLRGEIRRQSRRGDSPAQPEPVSLAAARRELLLDGDTVLLEYRLGETASTVWAVTRDTLAAFRLPPRSEIEPAARKAAQRLQSLEWRRRNPQALCDLGHLLLAPVEPFLRHRRVVVVADGALEALPFAALPLLSGSTDCRKAPVLVDNHETVSLPSVATLLTQRRALAGRRPAPGWLAVVANPAYDPAPADGRARRPLPASAEEAKALVEGFPAGKTLVVTGAAASRETVRGGALRGFRILHFATHGLLNADQPLLSALALAELDAQGRPVPQGTLPAHEIYGLDLPAELVVLSACETALGREVPGEGLVSGLPRAFLYAGSARVLVSLWKVEDESTRDLMILFYRGLLDRKLPPGRALAEAQRALRQEGRPPRDWAGFILLGDWRPLPRFSG
jgi:CHAT domain-containing protein/tetratricopeptide (TPR) repeat protein